jgi:hypothetical protein
MNTCRKCGKPVPEKAIICPECGAALASLPGLKSAELAEAIGQLLSTQGKIAAIKAYRTATGVGLAEAKQEVERIEAGLPPGTTRKAQGGGCGLQLFLLLIVAAIVLLILLFRKH